MNAPPAILFKPDFIKPEFIKNQFMMTLLWLGDQDLNLG